MSSSAAERVIGYDARLWPPDVQAWPERRRHAYLLRPEVRAPLSTDEMVWPAVFDGDPLAPDCPQRPDWTGRNGMLWDDLARLTSHLDHLWGRPWPAARLIAVTTVRGPVPGGLDAEWDDRTAGVIPATLPSGWERLGYDVSDPWQVSGLSNCGYTSDEVGPLRDRWGPRLNEHGLFADSADAGAFVAVCDARVQEHAPFSVYGLYVAERVGADR